MNFWKQKTRKAEEVADKNREDVMLKGKQIFVDGAREERKAFLKENPANSDYHLASLVVPHGTKQFHTIVLGFGENSYNGHTAFINYITHVFNELEGKPYKLYKYTEDGSEEVNPTAGGPNIVNGDLVVLFELDAAEGGAWDEEEEEE